jgi:hypothetical protein
MYFKNVWKMVVIIVLSLVVFIPVGQAQQSYDITECYSFTSHTTLSEVPDLTIVGFDGKGIVRSNVENKVFDNFTLHCAGIRRITDGKAEAHGYFKYLDPDGDFFFMEGKAAEGEVIMKFLSGTGKWKGVKGEGRIKVITRGKRITPDTNQVCYRHTGTFELPKK